MNKAPTFEEFWKAYPLHRRRGDAEKAWGRLTARDKRKAIAALPAYRDECQRTGAYYQLPLGWLRSRRWKDYEEEDEPTGTKTELSRKTGGEQVDLFSRAERKSGESQLPCGEPQGIVASPTSPLSDMEEW